jgi:Ca-activated chloride channel family protein
LEDKKTREFSYTVSFAKREGENDFIAKLWANRKVNHLLNKIRFEGENDELVKSVKSLAEEFGIVTPYTSYLVLEQQEEFAAAERNIANAPLLAKKLRDKQRSQQVKGMGAETLGALSGSFKDAAGARGKASVMSSRARQSVMEDAEQDEEMLITHKNISGKSFTLKDGQWKENGVKVTSQKVTIIKFMEREYVELAKKDKDLQKILSLGNQLLFEWQGTVYKIEK